MSSIRMNALRARADAAGGAFGFDEADFEPRLVRRASPGLVLTILIAIGGAAAGLAHHLGWTSLVAQLGGWRVAA